MKSPHDKQGLIIYGYILNMKIECDRCLDENTKTNLVYSYPASKRYCICHRCTKELEINNNKEKDLSNTYERMEKCLKQS